MRIKKSPMLEVLDTMDSSDGNGNQPLSTLWRVILRQLNIEAHQWENLLSRWCDRNTAIHGLNAISIKKNNLVKSLASRAMTWKTFWQGLQILNSCNRYSKIRFEVHFVPKDKSDTRVVCLNVYDRSQSLTNRPLNTDMSAIHTSNLSPGGLAVPGKYYQLSGFDNAMFNGAKVQRAGMDNVLTDSTTFNGCTAIGSLLLDAGGMESINWVMLTTLKAR